VQVTGSGSCPVAGFGISGVEPLGSAVREWFSILVLHSGVRDTVTRIY
jgi:hypothetical protein